MNHTSYFHGPKFSEDCCGWQEVGELGDFRVGSEKVREIKGIVADEKGHNKILRRLYNEFPLF